MIRNGNGFSGLEKGILIGGVLGAAATLLFASRSGMELGNDIPKESGRIRHLHLPLSTTRVEKISETEKPVMPRIGWRVIFYLASALAMFADLRIKKT
jgi:hypothetical protein